MIAYVGLGANLGDREATIRAALERLGNVPGVKVDAVSSLRETDPVGGPPQPKFLNGAARLETCLGPEALLEILKTLEIEAGRDPRDPPNHPRSLDLDLLIYGDQGVEKKGIQLPHPRMWDRPFVLDPLEELGCRLPLRAVTLDSDPSHIERITAAAHLAERAASLRAGGFTIGFVPTMGALHAGHASLMRRARRECDRLVVSIFVNPLQFGSEKDLRTYPSNIADDFLVLGEEGVDLLFTPSADELFPPGFASKIQVGAEAEGMEGACRPGHFAGVATVVARLWLLVNPHRSYFGRKDAQQFAALRRLHDDLALSGEILACPIIRDADGLALSSRNQHLQGPDRSAATVLFKALSSCRELYLTGERRKARLLAAARELLDAEPRCHLDYLELRVADSLAELSEPIDRPPQALVAAVIGESPASGTRLIDNMLLQEESS
ncbi:MAG: pantoate--beta-alanine ligase [Planctomycetota bacterium]